MGELPYPQNHPHYVQGVEAERQNILNNLREEYAKLEQPDRTDPIATAFFEGYIAAMITALDCVEGIELEDGDE